MARIFSLAFSTPGAMPAPDMVTLAADAGFDAVGFRMLPAAPGGPVQALIGDTLLLRETLARLKDTGLTVVDAEIVRINAAFDVAATQPFLETAAALGARHILVAGDDPDEARLIGNYAAFCQAAARYTLTADLEFMPWAAVKSAGDALRVVRAAAQPNSGIIVDALHVARSATTLADLAAIPRDLLHYAQLCDARGPTPATDEGLIYTARCARLLPGDGDGDIAGMLGALPPDLPIGVEIPNDAERARLGVSEWARRTLAACRTAAGSA
ncbi:MAG: sugar phosphate isomerase/epimerase family protein [Beijerinckiaceae bacterium]